MKKILLLAFALISTPQFAQSWVQVTDIPSGRHHPVGFTLNGMGYSATGSNSSSRPSKDFYQYDPVADAWTTLTDFPGSERSFAIGTVLDGKAYLGFGATLTQYLDDLWSYDDQTSQWTQLATCPCTGRRHPAMLATKNRIYIGLGDDASGNLNDWWMYTVDADSWTRINDLPGPPRHHPFQFNAGGELFAGLGHNGNAIYRDWYKLDTASNSWTAMSLFPGEARVAGTQFAWNSAGFVLSGDGDNHSFMATGEMWRYTPSSDSWAQFPPHPGISRWAPGNFVINDEIYFFGGQNRQNAGYPTELWKFDLAAATISIDEEVLANLAVYPNPAQNVLNWESDESITKVALVNILGQSVGMAEAKVGNMDISNLENGVYFVKFYAEKKHIKTSKVLIQH